MISPSHIRTTDLVNRRSSSSPISRLKRVQILENVLGLSLCDRFAQSLSAALLRAREEISHVPTPSLSTRSHSSGNVVSVGGGGGGEDWRG